MLNVLVGSCNHLSEPIKMWRSKLTDDDLYSIDHNYDYLVSLLEKKYGYTELHPPKLKSSSAWPNTTGDISL